MRIRSVNIKGPVRVILAIEVVLIEGETIEGVVTIGQVDCLSSSY